jgi:tyrosyl-tRNA synthetase
MNNSERLELIKRNTVEIIEEDELKKLLKEKKHPVVYCGYEVSGEVHLGHLVTISKLMDFEKAGFKVIVLFADYHTWLNQKGDWGKIRKLTKLWEKVFNAFGLEKADYVLGSSFQRKEDYVDDVMKISVKTTINRALRSMQEIARDIEHAKVSQVIYPFMQVEDIKELSVDVASSGVEQRKIHMLAREVLPEIGYKVPICVHTPLIPSLKGPGGKMSSSVPESLISVRDSPESIKKKINKAYCPEGAVDDNPVLAIARLIIFPMIDRYVVERVEKFGGNLEFKSYEELEKEFVSKKLHPLDLKNSVIKYLVEILAPVRKIIFA